MVGYAFSDKIGNKFKLLIYSLLHDLCCTSYDYVSLIKAYTLSDFRKVVVSISSICLKDFSGIVSKESSSTSNDGL